MQPDTAHISIDNNRERIERFLEEVILAPRKRMVEWSKITNQTPNLKIGYPGQHLASLLTGMKGTATGARGEDIVDGTEVKSCSRVDQLDKCNECKTSVLRTYLECPVCGSRNIKRNNDSKWLISIRNEKELNMYLCQVPRMLFLLFEYPNFKRQDYSSIRIAAYEIWNQSERAHNFRQLLHDYYHLIYIPHVERDAKKQPAPKDFWPHSFQFYMSNPIKMFECLIKDFNGDTPAIEIVSYVEPHVDRTNIASENLPCNLLSRDEVKILKEKGWGIEKIESLDEQAKKALSLRDTSKAKPQNQTYVRRKTQSIKQRQ
jgi:hypothetical protein